MKRKEMERKEQKKKWEKGRERDEKKRKEKKIEDGSQLELYNTFNQNIGVIIVALSILRTSQATLRCRASVLCFVIATGVQQSWRMAFERRELSKELFPCMVFGAQSLQQMIGPQGSQIIKEDVVDIEVGKMNVRC